MSRYLVVILAFVLGFLSCSKNEGSYQAIPQDNIIYTQFQPFVELTSVDTFVDHPSGCGLIPVPGDSYLEYMLDIDDNGTDDFMLVIKTWYYFVSASGPCRNYQYRIELRGLYENMVTSEGMYSLPVFLNSGDVIDQSLEWQSTTNLMMDVAGAPFSSDFEGDRYVGLKLSSGKDSYFGWLYLSKLKFTVTLKACAVNQAANNSIQAGQIE